MMHGPINIRRLILLHDNIHLYLGHAVVRNTINTAGNTNPSIKIK